MGRLSAVAAIALAAAMLAAGCVGHSSGDTDSSRSPKGVASAPADAVGNGGGPGEGLERIVLGGGCFWCIEAVMELLEGVSSATSGYAGGSTPDPTYEKVLTGNTGHAEVVAVDYDPAVVPLERLLDVFFASHDPTTLNRQGPDKGSQYRSIVLYLSEGQGEAVRAYVAKAAPEYDSPIVTEVLPLARFYPAEDYHQDYYAKNPGRPYCEAVISPKVEEAKKML